jgi:hypothetical protein
MIVAQNAPNATTATESPSRRIFTRLSRYRLRSLLIAMAACCVVMGVWVIYVQPFREQAASAKQLADLGVDTAIRPAVGPAWQRWLVETMDGNRAFVHVVGADLRNCPQMPVAFQSLASLRHLKYLYVDRSDIDPEGAAMLGGFRDLESLSLTYAGVDDAELMKFAPLTKLQALYLSGNPISSASVGVIESMPALQELYVRWTRLTAEDIRRLQKALPACRIYYHQLQ